MVTAASAPKNTELAAPVGTENTIVVISEVILNEDATGIAVTGTVSPKVLNCCPIVCRDDRIMVEYPQWVVVSMAENTLSFVAFVRYFVHRVNKKYHHLNHWDYILSTITTPKCR
jgi:hypothetical protein